MRFSREPISPVLVVALLLLAPGVSLPASPRPQASQSGDRTNAADSAKTKKSSNDASGKSSTTNTTQKSNASAQPGDTVNKLATPVAAQQSPSANTSGMVWVNTESGVYHQPGSRYYGKTKQGKYMSEADAIKAGYRPSDRN